MKLREIQIKGFKSFADSLVIRPSEGITAIVGPNGSGKSNLVDAIRWVLGEQKTRVLRSGKMENVIFNGTVAQRPLQMAEVSLGFEDTRHVLSTTHSEVNITRRLYRNGESEYELNGLRSRLKDIQNLIVDSGLGAEGYAIIELKMVDDLLHDTHQARKNLFNQVAGIARFHQRKQETDRHLAHTEADLQRMEDVLVEIERNLKSLKAQAESAKKYHQLKLNYQSISAYYASKKLQALVLDRERLLANLASEEAAHSAQRATNQKQSALLAQHKKDQLLIEKELQGTQRSLQALEKKLLADERSYDLSVASLQMQAEQVAELSSSMEGYKLRLSSYAKEKEVLLVQEKPLKKELRTLDTRLQKEKASYALSRQTLSDLESDWQKGRAESESIQAQHFQLQKAHAVCVSRTEGLRQQLMEQQAHQQAQQKEAASVKVKWEAQKRLQEKLSADLEACMAEKAKLDAEIADKLAALANENARIQSIKQAKEAAWRELQLLEKMDKAREGFNTSVRFLHEHANWNAVHAPLLCDIIQCAPEDRALIEAALRPYLQYHVVNTRTQAQKGVKLLSQAKKGQGAFFILEEIPNVSSPKQGYGTPLFSRIQCAKPYQPLLRWLTFRLRVIEGDQVPPVQKDLIYIHKKGNWMTDIGRLEGGLLGHESARATLLSASVRDELKAHQKELEVQFAHAEQKSEQLRVELGRLEGDSFKEKREALAVRYEEESKVEVALRAKWEHMNTHLASQEAHVSALGKELAALAKEEAQLKEALAAAAGEQKAVAVKLKALGDQVAHQREALEGQEAPLEALTLAHQKLVHQLTDLRARVQLQDEKHKEWVEDEKHNHLKIKELKASIKEKKEAQIDLKASLKALYDDKRVLEVAVRDVEGRYGALQREVRQVEEALRGVEKKEMNSQWVVGELRTKIDSIKREEAGILERFLVEFPEAGGIEKASAQPLAKWLNMSLEALEAELNKLRARFMEREAVNPLAMESYQTLSERHAFIVRERNDLLEAKHTLEKTIHQLDKEATKVFLSAFEQIKTHFKKLFGYLFGKEDVCDIELTNPAQPLQSPIRILAHPKGKKPISIEQLSSGEKALTAVALLFAAYLCRPAPFCILDEVDAPLDDANTAKFNLLIRKLSQQAQFIIVTHNKNTMKEADVLYGMTMLQKGISRILPVHMEDIPA